MADKREVKNGFAAKTIAEAEEAFRTQLGVKCRLDGFKKSDMAQVQEIFACVSHHFTDFPELRDKIKFVGSVKGRVAALEDVKYTELCKLNPGMQDDVLRKYAKNWAKRMAGCSSSTYAYSSKNFTEYALNGLAFNSTWAGTKVKKQLEYDVQHKFHPVGCDTVKAVFDHELGHKIDEMLSLYTDPDFWLSTIRPKLKENDSSPITCRHMRIAPLSSVSPITRRKRNLLPKRGASIGITKNRDLWQSR